MQKYHERASQKAAPVVATAEEPARRSTRKPFGSLALKLAYPDRPGYHRHWFNDVPGRIHRALEAGYEHVKDAEGKNVSRIVGVAEGGGPLTAFVMEIPEEFYQEDMKAEQDQITAKEELLKRGEVDRPEKGYVPSQGISIGSK